MAKEFHGECRECGDEFTAYGMGAHLRKYCDEHYKGDSTAKPEERRQCQMEGCKKSIPTMRGLNARYCSSQHQMKAQNQRAEARRKAKRQAQSLFKNPQGNDYKKQARQGETYERIQNDPILKQQLLDGVITASAAAVKLDVTTAAVTRAMQAVLQDIAIERQKEEWSQSWKVKAMLPTEMMHTLREVEPDGAIFNLILNHCVKAYATFSRYYFRLEGKRPLVMPFHRKWIASIIRAWAIGGKQLILSPPRHGKALDDDTPVRTRRGWVRHGDVEVGDEIVGRGGEWRKVTFVHPRNYDEAYRVTMSDGSSLVTHANHEWEVVQRYGGPARRIETRALADDLHEADGRRKWRIPLTTVEGTHTDLPVDPYLFGCWLGDGSSYKAEITTADDEIIEAFRGEYPTTYEYEQGEATTYGMVGGLYTTLKSMGVISNKHIPDQYLNASSTQRLAVLQGLMDTDGWAAKNGSQQAYSTTSPELAEGFRLLVTSLGGTYTQRERTVDGRPGHETAWEIYPRLPHGMEAFRLERKQARMTAPSARNEPRRFVASVEPVGKRSMRCITVDGGIYGAGLDNVMTHNSEMLVRFVIWFVCMDPNIRIGWFCASRDVAELMLGAVKDHLDNNERLINDVLPPGELFNPGLKSGKPWSRKEIKVAQCTHVGQKSSTLLALGLTSKFLSRDMDLIVIDDPEDFDSTQEEAQRKKARNKLAEIGTRKEEHTAMAYISSRQHPDDIPAHLLALEGTRQAWNTIVDSAHDAACGLEPDNPDTYDLHQDCMLFPQVRTYRWLMEKKEEMEVLGVPHAFSMRYLNHPIPEDGQVFDVPVIRDVALNRHRGLGLDGLPLGHLAAGLDPSARGIQASFLWHYTTDTRYEQPIKMSMVDLDASKAGGVAGAVDIICDWFHRYGVTLWFYETNSQQIEFYGLVKEGVRKRMEAEMGHNPITIKDHSTGQNKKDAELGISAMAPLYHNGNVDLPYGTNEARVKVNMLLRQLELWTSDGVQTKKALTDIKMAQWFPFVGRIQRALKDARTLQVREGSESSYSNYSGNDVAWETAYPMGGQ